MESLIINCNAFFLKKNNNKLIYYHRCHLWLFFNLYSQRVNLLIDFFNTCNTNLSGKLLNGNSMWRNRRQWYPCVILNLPVLFLSTLNKENIFKFRLKNSIEMEKFNFILTRNINLLGIIVVWKSSQFISSVLLLFRKKKFFFQRN